MSVYVAFCCGFAVGLCVGWIKLEREHRAWMRTIERLKAKP